MIHITPDASLLAHNTFGIDVKAKLYAEYDNTDDLRQLLLMPEVKSLMDESRSLGNLPFWHIGSGSNLLFKGDYHGVVFHCNATGIEIIEDSPTDCVLKVQAGTLWDDVCVYCVQHGLYGAENLSIIPGEAGAAAVQNIGAYGVEIKDIIDVVICWDVIDMCERRLSAADMQYSYRQSLLKQAEAKGRYIVISVILRLSRIPVFHLEYAGLRQALTDGSSAAPASDVTLTEVRDAVISIRQGKLPDPKEIGNAGSFFKNPVVPNTLFESLLVTYPTMPHYVVDEGHTKIPAGWLIEQCGWKGRSLGRAGVYQKQSLVLVNLGGATSQEIIALCRTIQQDVNAKFGIQIEAEVNII